MLQIEEILVLPLAENLPSMLRPMGQELRPAVLRQSGLPFSLRVCLTLLPICLLVLLLRGIPLFAHTYPSGNDYGHYSYYAELFLTTGKLPSIIPYYQLGTTNWAV